jgi:hypothetical protein
MKDIIFCGVMSCAVVLHRRFEEFVASILMVENKLSEHQTHPDLVFETLCFLVFRIPDHGQSPDAQWSWVLYTIVITLRFYKQETVQVAVCLCFTYPPWRWPPKSRISGGVVSQKTVHFIVAAVRTCDSPFMHLGPRHVALRHPDWVFDICRWRTPTPVSIHVWMAPSHKQYFVFIASCHRLSKCFLLGL